jgi:hypothetical protein
VPAVADLIHPEGKQNSRLMSAWPSRPQGQENLEPSVRNLPGCAGVLPQRFRLSSLLREPSRYVTARETPGGARDVNVAIQGQHVGNLSSAASLG